KRLAIALEQLDLAVNRKHFLDEGAAEVQQAHRERSLVVGAEGKPCFLQELAEVRAQFDGGRGFASAGGARLYQQAVGNFACAAENLTIRKAIVAPEPADGLAFALNKC